MPFTYFTEDDLRALPDMDNVSKFSPDRLEAAHDWIAGIVERECETSFVATTVTAEKVTGSGTDSLRLPDAYVRDVTAVTVDGVAYTSGQLDALIVEDGYLYAATGGYWPATSRQNVTVTYTRGWSSEPPPDLKEAMLKGARNWVLTSAAWSGTDSRATAITNEWGNVQISTAANDRPTGLPDVDATIMAWRSKVRVPKVR